MMQIEESQVDLINRFTTKLKASVGDQAAELMLREARIEQLTEALAAKDGDIKELAEALAAKDGEIERLKVDCDELASEVDNLISIISDGATSEFIDPGEYVEEPDDETDTLVDDGA